jgi:hypothetical protein
MIFTLKMSQNVEIVSNLQLNFFGLKVRHRGSQSSIFVRTFRSFTSRLSDCEPAEAKNEGGIHRANVFAQWMLLV